MQQVLTIPAVAVRSFYDFAAFHTTCDSIQYILNTIERDGHFVDRETAENDPALRQLVACALVRNNGRVLCLRRSRSGNRKSLQLRYTLLPGGHVESVDDAHGNALQDCVRRELVEELGVSVASDPVLLGFVTDPSTPVGTLHLGAVFEVAFAEASVTLSPKNDTAEFVHQNKTRIVNLMNGPELVRLRGSLDPWSRLVLASPIGERLTGHPSGEGYHRQLFLRFD